MRLNIYIKKFRAIESEYFRASYAPTFLIIAALLFLSFVAGAAVTHFRWGPGQWLNDAFTGGKAWKEKADTIRSSKKIKATAAFSLKKYGRVVLHKEGSAPGYTLIAVNKASAAWLVDAEGKIVHQWSLPFNAVWPNPPHIKNPVPDNRISWGHAHVYPNGDLVAIFNGNGDTPFGYGAIKVDRNSRLLWKYAEHVHHKLDVGPDGRIYLLIQYFSHEPIQSINMPSPFLLDSVVVLNSDGVEEKRVDLIKAFQRSPYMNVLVDRDAKAERGDLLHTNAVWVLRENTPYHLPSVRPGQVLFSVREYNVIGVLDLEKQEVVWATKGPWRGQHDPRFLENGNILLFDNLGLVPPTNNNPRKKRSRILEYDPMTKRNVWVYSGGKGSFYTRSRGSVQMLPNGNILLAESVHGRIREVSRDKKAVWEYLVRGPMRVVITTAHRYTEDQLPFLKEKSHAQQ